MRDPPPPTAPGDASPWPLSWDTRKAWRLAGARPLLPQGQVGIIQKRDLPRGEPRPECGGADGPVVRVGMTTPQGLPPNPRAELPWGCALQEPHVEGLAK